MDTTEREPRIHGLEICSILDAGIFSELNVFFSER